MRQLNGIISVGSMPNPFKNAVAATDMYDFKSEQWSSADAIPTLRAGALAGAAGDDIIVAGGEINTSSQALDTVEAMNVYTRRWRSLKAMGAGRHSGAGVVLNNQFHVVAGSLNTGGAPETSVHESLPVDLVASPDFDADGLSNSDERGIHGTNPGNADTDSDSLNDKQELTQYASNPLQSDTDNDGIDDGAEVSVWNTDPANADSDADGLNDFEEAFTFNTNPNLADTDADKLSDTVEVLEYFTDPASKDTDADGVEDGDEVLAGTNPLIADADSGSSTGSTSGTTQGTSEGSGDGVTVGATNGTGAGTAGTNTDGVTDTDGTTGPGLTSGGTALGTTGQSVGTTSGETNNSASGGSVSILLLFAMLGWRLALRAKVTSVI